MSDEKHDCILEALQTASLIAQLQADRDDLRAQVARLTATIESAANTARAEVTRLEGALQCEAIRAAGNWREVERVRKERDEISDAFKRWRTDHAAQLAAALAERDEARHICVCIECGRCKIDEDGCCTTCGRDALLLEDGRLVTEDFADNLETDVQRQTAERIAQWLASPQVNSDYGKEFAIDILGGKWKDQP